MNADTLRDLEEHARRADWLLSGVILAASSPLENEDAIVAIADEARTCVAEIRAILADLPGTDEKPD